MCPLGVIKVNYGKQESVFEKLAPFVDKMVNLYNQVQMQKWDNEWMTMAIKDIEKASNPEAIDALFAKANPPSGYIDTEGFTNFAQEAIGMINMTSQPAADLMGKNLPALTAVTGETPKTGLGIKDKPGETPETQLMPDKMEWNELYKFVSELPDGQVDWNNTLGVFQQRLESKKKMGESAMNMMNQILGQGVPDQRAKFEEDVKFTDYLQQTLYPESETKMPGSEMELFLTNPELYQEYQKAKQSGKPEIDLDKFNQWMTESGMELSGGSVNPTTGNLSYNFRPKADSPMELGDMIKMIKELEQHGIKASYTKDGLSISAASTGESKPSSDYERWLADPESFEKFKAIGKTDTGKTPTLTEAERTEARMFDKVETKADYNREINRLKSLNIDTSAFSYAEVMREKYNNAIQWLEYATSQINAGVQEDEDYNYNRLYKDMKESATRYNEEYFKETGKRLSESIGDEKVDKMAKKNITMQFVDKLITERKTFKSYTPEQLAIFEEMGVDMEMAKEMLIKRMQGGWLW